MEDRWFRLGDHGRYATMALDRTLLKSVYNDCGWETIPLEKITILASQMEFGDVDTLMADIESLDLNHLENDAGDVGDEYWRIAVSVARILVSLGSDVISTLEKYRTSPHKYVAMTIRMTEGALSDPSYFDY